jgi:CotH protein/lamin tail-like protein/Fn3 domain-containing protein
MENVLRLLTLLASTVLLLISQSTAQIRINEVCASNSESLYDEDSDTPDWIELYNYSDQPVNLSSWRISDQQNYDFAWQFPDTIIYPNEYLLVYASGKNKIGKTKYSMKNISNGSIVPFNNRDAYRYRYKQLSGDFIAELNIRAQKNEGVWSLCGIHIRADLSDTTNFFGMFVGSKAKDGFFNYWRDTILYIPKIKALYGSLNLPYTKLRLSRKNDSLYCSYIDRKGKEGFKESYHNFLPESLLIGVSVSAYNENQFAEFILDSFLINDIYTDILSLDLYEVNYKENGVDKYYKELHTDFSIKDDESIYLYKATELKDSVKLLPMTGDVSNIITEENLWKITDITTPGSINGKGYLGRIAKPKISYSNGFVKITGADNSEIRYTLDNSTPTYESLNYNSNTQLKINSTTMVKAKVYKDGYLPSFVQSELIRIKEPEFKLPIISISADSIDLWGDYGILVEDNLRITPRVNASFNYYSSKKDIAQNIQIKIHGNNSKYYPQKSFRLYADEKMESNTIKNDYFKSVVNNYSQLVFRNSGTDWTETFLKDAYNGIISKQVGSIISASYTPVMAYLNSEFYGLLNLRERLNSGFLSEYYGIDVNSINYYEDNGDYVGGDYFKYNKYYNFILENKFVENDKYELIDSLIEINNFMNYTLIGIYAANYDWPWKNIKLFHSEELDNRFRYLIHDMDWTYSHFGYKPYQDKIGLMLTDTFSHVSIILKRFLENEKFKNQYLTRAADLVNSVFKPNNMSYILDSLTDQIREYIPLQQERWEGSCLNWEEKIEEMKVFLDERPEYFMKNFDIHLNSNLGTSIFSLSTYPPNSGGFQVNTITIDTSVWSGRYFQALPITITAVPKHGMKFIKWNHDSLGANPTITTTLPENIELEAIYEKIDFNELDRAIVINEIMYNADKDQDTKDWVELYNTGKEEVNLKGWSIIDEDTTHSKFVIEEDFKIQPNEYVIITREKEDFEKIIIISNKKTGDFSFGLGGNDIIRLIDEKGVTHDSVNYDNDAPWPVGADGTGYTIELINPILDNNLGENWKISKMKLGTAGTINSNYDTLQTNVKDNLNTDRYEIFQFNRNITLYSEHIINKFDIFNITGSNLNMEVKSKLYANQLILDLSTLNRGIYILQVQIGTKMESIKILLK